MRRMSIGCHVLGVLVVAATHSVAAQERAPELLLPPNGVALSDFRPMLSWEPASGALTYQLMVTPFNGDGPGIDLIVADTAYAVPAPPMWYGLLPDMTYSWGVRARGHTGEWGPWSEEWTFRTPAASGHSITPEPRMNGSLLPTGDGSVLLRWKNAQRYVWRYEIQIAKDNPSFSPEVVVLWRTIALPRIVTPRLEFDARYYWRVRPRMQGDGAPAAWSEPDSFVVQQSLVPPPSHGGSSYAPPWGPGDLQFSPLVMGTAFANCQLSGYPIPAGTTTVYVLAPFTGSQGWFLWQWARDDGELAADAWGQPYIGLGRARYDCASSRIRGELHFSPPPAAGTPGPGGGGGPPGSGIRDPLPPGQYAVHLRSVEDGEVLQSVRFTIPQP